MTRAVPLRISPDGSSHCSHPLAALGALKTSLDAILHVADGLAARCACPADLGARATHGSVLGGVARHEVEGRLADLGAIEHQPHVGRLGVLSAHLQAVGSRHVQARQVAVVTVLHALLHLRRHVVLHSVHRLFSCLANRPGRPRKLRTKVALPSELNVTCGEAAAPADEPMTPEAECCGSDVRITRTERGKLLHA
jgi:hypothetical protein